MARFYTLAPGEQYLKHANGRAFNADDWHRIRAKGDETPGLLTDEDLGVLESFDGLPCALEYEKRRAEAKGPPRQAASAAAPAISAVVPEQSVEEFAADTKKWHEFVDDFVFHEVDDEKAMDIVRRFLDGLTTIASHKRFHWALPFLYGMRSMNNKNRHRNERLDAIEARTAALEGNSQARGTSMLYQGIWDAAKEYTPGDVVTDRGSAWICKTKASGIRPEFNNGVAAAVWGLVVKRGADGKDGRDASGR